MFIASRVPVIVAPMAGGISTPELIGAVTKAGGFGFLPAGYLSPATLAEGIERTAALTDGFFGVNLFVPGEHATDDLAGYQDRMAPEAAAYGVSPGEPTWNDDSYSAKVAAVIAHRIPVVSFTFGYPDDTTIRQLHNAGCRIVVTVTTPAEAEQASAMGADALCVQGFEAGAHRGSWANDRAVPSGTDLYGLLALLRLVRSTTTLPLIATGGLMHGADIAAVLTAGADGAQLGTAFLLCPEAGTASAHRAALSHATRATAVTRAFTGRPARGLVNRFLTENSDHAPAAYPEVHQLTKPIRDAASAKGDPEAMSLWAGQAYPLAESIPAADVVARLESELQFALDRAHNVWSRSNLDKPFVSDHPVIR